VGTNWSKPVDTILGGWELSGILRLQSGFPLALPAGARINNTGQSAKLDNPTIDRWFNTSAFTAAPAFGFGTSGPVSPDVRAAALRNVDAVMAKTFAVTIKDRKVTTQFRAEFFNLFNHPQFAAPNATFSSQAFGQVTAVANAPRDMQFGLKLGF
jgi:hypothetical protein